MREFYTFLIHYRPEEGSILLQCGGLFLQFIIDHYPLSEAWRLLYIKNHQSTLWAELSSALQDANTADENDAHVVAKRLILHTSVTGRPCYMRQHVLYAMSICDEMGYLEIQDAFPQQSSQYANYQTDIIVVVFCLMLKELKEISKTEIVVAKSLQVLMPSNYVISIIEYKSSILLYS